MIRYKVKCENNKIVCIKKENKKEQELLNKNEFIEIIDKFIGKEYNIVFDGKNIILVGLEEYIFIEDFKRVLSSSSLRKLRDDILKTIIGKGYTKSSDKRKKGKIRKIHDESILNVDDELYLEYYSPKKKNLFNHWFRNIVQYTLLLTLTLHILPMCSKGLEPAIEYKNGATIPLHESIYLYLNQLFGVSNSKDKNLDIYNVESSLPVESEEVEPTLEVDEGPSEEDIYREAIYNFLVKEEMTLEQFSNLLTSMTKDNCPFETNWITEKDAFLDICFRDNRTPEDMFLIIMAKEGCTYDELDYICAGCVGEAKGDGECYVDAYAVASTLLNRKHDSVYVNNHGNTLYGQFTAPGQYEVAYSGMYLDYLGRIDLIGYQAILEAFYTGESMHDYLEFRGSWVDVPYKYEQFVTNGNKYLVKMKESRILEDEEFVLDEEEINQLKLTNY